MKKLNVIIGCIVFVMLFSICSCGVRKVNKESSKEEIKTESIDNSVTEKQIESNIKTTTILKTFDNNKTISKEDVYEPVDPTKEASVIDENGKKTILNNSKKTSKTISQNNNTKSELIGNSEQLEKEAVKEQKAVKQANVSKKENESKQTTNSGFRWYYLLLLLIPIGIAYVLYRNYKKIPLVPKF